jgi:outer membrane protein assembly factor BamB
VELRLLTTLAALCLCFSALSVTQSASPPASTSDWPQWRGPQRSGVSQESGLLKQWPPDGPKLLWQVNDIGDGYSTPSVVGNRIYLMSNRGFENEFVQALSAQDGKPIWTTRIGNVGNANDFLYAKARSTPTVDGELLYALGSDGDLACLETKSRGPGLMPSRRWLMATWLL